MRLLCAPQICGSGFRGEIAQLRRATQDLAVSVGRSRIKLSDVNYGVLRRLTTYLDLTSLLLIDAQWSH